MKLVPILVVIFGLTAWGPLAIAAEEPRTVTGIITSVKPSERTIRVRGNETRERHTYYIPEGATITMGGQPARLNRVMVGHQVTLRFVQPAEGPRQVVTVRVPEPEQIVDVPAEPAEQVAMLPKTASLLPALGLLGLGFLSAGMVMRSRRRRS